MSCINGVRMMRAFVFAGLALGAQAAVAQDFYSPDKFPGASTPLLSYVRDEVKCWAVSVSTTLDYTFELSGSTTGCSPVDGQLALYPPGALDQASWLALVDDTEQGECVRFERRLTAGAYTVCAGSSWGEPASLAVRMFTATAATAPKHDTCTNAELLSGSSGTVSVSLRGAKHDYRPLPLKSCAAAQSSHGPDVVYAVDVDAYSTLNVTLLANKGLPSLYLLDSCSIWWRHCLAASDNSGISNESISYKNGASKKRYYIVVDSPVAEHTANFSMTWSVVK